ncbi:(2Fe-2S)-binding protein [Pelomonas sp. SE-A7]|uniref:(2Fe-2S)-binding protein n=1 Tax=Pelomonas sp. SE-A7 TaxID=3054953 RepID=UPI00259CD33E|nr:(2Fe-2S)-binding protein [Pelomonas sp. SE-A7]MDM4767470.1 (2Fe-2S)-binding protein [Pelomonas sp. SE-A7]
MIVCLCHRVSDRDIRHAVSAGVRNFELLQDETSVASACGSCLDCAREEFDAAVARCHDAAHCMAEPGHVGKRVIALQPA